MGVLGVGEGLDGEGALVHADLRQNALPLVISPLPGANLLRPRIEMINITLLHGAKCKLCGLGRVEAKRFARPLLNLPLGIHHQVVVLMLVEVALSLLLNGEWTLVLEWGVFT